MASASLPDIGRSLRLARQQAEFSVEEAASLAALTSGEVEDLESGAVSRMRDRVETLRSLRRYADALGLPGHDFLLAVVELWPPPERVPSRPGDSGQVPTVSVSAAPEGGHSPAGDGRTGVTDFSISGVVSPLAPSPIHDTGQIPIVDTGEIPAVRQSPPTWLKGLVVAAGILVVLGIFALTEHSHFSAWTRMTSRDPGHWIHDAEVAAGLTSNPAGHSPARANRGLPSVVMVQNPAANLVTVNVHASHFTVKIAAVKYPSWVQVTDTNQQAPIFEQVLAGGADYSFSVQGTMTVETGSGSARAYLYEDGKFIGFFFPTKAPYTLTFHTVS
ncbi:MAG TPA: helix-turn-helix transcriptional regulator [Acidimicrobiales bacterium]|nr:helix-turn-helix transcriptional regulator [Acidimicrobiales bacterium]